MTSSVGSDFQTIKSWDKVDPFAGRVVAYQTDSIYFGAGQGYTIDDIHFGYIDQRSVDWQNNEKGYNMTRLLKPQDVSGNCALIRSQLKSFIAMRLATKEEVGLISKAISLGQARFEYMSEKERINAILKRQLSQL